MLSRPRLFVTLLAAAIAPITGTVVVGCAANEAQSPAEAQAQPATPAAEEPLAEPSALRGPEADPGGGAMPKPSPAPMPSGADDITNPSKTGCVGHNCPDTTAQARRPAPGTIGSSVRLIGEPAVGGGLGRDLIRRSTESHVDELAACHEQQLGQKPDIAGELVVSLTIDREGKVSKAELGDDSDLGNSVIEQCVIAAIEGWRFAEPDGREASIELRFEFAPK